MKIFWRFLSVLFASVLLASASQAVSLDNAGFEQGWKLWQPKGDGLVLSEKAHTGRYSVKLTKPNSYVARVVTLEPDHRYQLTAQLLGLGTLGVKVDGQMFFDQPESKSRDWQQLSVVFESQGATQAIIFASYAGAEGRFDDFSLLPVKNNTAPLAATLQPKSEGGTGLSPDLAPSRNFDLLGWYLSTPRDDDGDGIGDLYKERELARGFEDDLYFFTHWDGGMTFRAPNKGGKTSNNTKFTRSELREMLRRGDESIKTKGPGGPNKNNWVFSTAPERAQRMAGAVDGRMEATLAVNNVTTSGKKYQVGRVIIGQIHASKDEPVRLYYRKLPNNKRGSVYMAHEPSRGHGKEVFIDLVGSRADDAPDPVDGIALDEKFSYVIDAKGHRLLVEIYVDGDMRGRAEVDMSKSGYDVADDYMYFKAGVYNQNNTGREDDFVQATFYRLETFH